MAVAACVLALTGCAANRDGTPNEPAASPLAVTQGQNLLLPLDAYRPSPREESVIDRAGDELFRRCMARLGIAAPDREPGGLTAADPNRDRYMLTDERAARTRGYHPPPAELAAARRATAEPRPGQADFTAAASGRGAARVNGISVPPGGCAGEAARLMVPGSGAAALRRVDDLSAWSWGRAQRDRRVVAAFASWSTCMTKAGHPYRTPMAVNNDPAFSGPEPTAREIATAVSDVRCKREVNLVGRWAAVEAAYQRQAITRHRAELDNAKKTVSAQLAVAAKVAREG